MHISPFYICIVIKSTRRQSYSIMSKGQRSTLEHCWMFKHVSLRSAWCAAAHRNSVLPHFVLRCNLHGQNLNACIVYIQTIFGSSVQRFQRTGSVFQFLGSSLLWALEKQNVYFMRKRLSNWWVKIDSSDWQTLFSILSFCSVCCSNK